MKTATRAPSIARPHRRVAPSLLVAAAAGAAWGVAAAVALSCGGSAGCTQIGCESTAVIVYSQPVAGPHDLLVEGVEDGTTLVRCSDPGALESEDKPEWIECDGNGFELVGPNAESGSLTISITLIDPDATEVLHAEVVTLRLSQDGIFEPNGPGCGPVCTERFGEVLFPNDS